MTRNALLLTLATAYGLVNTPAFAQAVDDDANSSDALESEDPESRKERAEKQFRAGVSLQKVDDFQAAIAAYQASLALHPTKSALFNLANCQRAIHRYAESYASLERLQRDYQGELDPDMQLAVEAQKHELANLTGLLTVVVQVQEENASGVEILVDGQPRGVTPLRSPIRVSLGAHKIEVALTGYSTNVISIAVPAGGSVTHTIKLEPAAPPSPEVPESVSPEPNPTPPPVATDSADNTAEDKSSDNTAAWVFTGLGGVLLAGGATTGAWALSIDNDLSASCPGGNCSQQHSSKIDKLNTLALTTDVLMGLGAASVITGLVLFSLPSEEADSTNLGLTVAPTYLGARATGTF